MLPIGARLRRPRRSLVSSPVSAPISSYQPWSPLSLQPKLWLDASDTTTITDSGGAVSEWRDKSGNGYAFTQATGGAQPTTGTTTQNGLNVLAFDGGDLLASTAAASEWKFLHDGTDALFGIVFKRNVAGAGHTLFATGAVVSTVNQTGLMVRALGTNNYSVVGVAAAGTTITNATAALGTSTVARAITTRLALSNAAAAPRVTLQIDGSVAVTPNATTGTPSTADPYGTLSIGALSTAAQYLNGFIAEIVMVTGSAVNETNRTVLHDYLNRKWAVY